MTRNTTHIPMPKTDNAKITEFLLFFSNLPEDKRRYALALMNTVEDVRSKLVSEISHKGGHPMTAAPIRCTRCRRPIGSHETHHEPCEPWPVDKPSATVRAVPVYCGACVYDMRRERERREVRV